MFRMTTTVTRMTTAQQVSADLTEVVVAAADDAGISQRRLSEMTGIPLVTISRTFRGLRSMNVLDLAAIADALGTSITDLALRAERKRAA